MASVTEGLDIRAPDEARLVAIVLHPHPRFGGDRFHPFVDSLHRRLPDIGVAAIRFDFVSEDMPTAQGQVETAVDAAASRWPGLGIVLAGYSFGAGVAAAVSDPRLAGWLLLAPQAEPLSVSPLKSDPRPKLILVPEHDQFGPPQVLRRAVGSWPATTVSVVGGADHFLGNVSPIVDTAIGWIESFLTT